VCIMMGDMLPSGDGQSEESEYVEDALTSVGLLEPLPLPWPGLS
jgi:hypothetical protein